MHLTQRLLIKIPTFQDETDRFLEDLVRDERLKPSHKAIQKAWRSISRISSWPSNAPANTRFATLGSATDGDCKPASRC